jgi:hypothetical protein
MRGDGRHALRQAARMDEFTNDDLFLDAVEKVVMVAL